MRRTVIVRQNSISVGYAGVAARLRRAGLFLLVLMPLVSLLSKVELIRLGELSVRVVDVVFMFAWVLWVAHTLLTKGLRRRFLLFLLMLGLYTYTVVAGSLLVEGYQVDWTRHLRFTETLLWGGLALSFVRSREELESIVNSIIFTVSIIALSSVIMFSLHPDYHRVAAFFSAAGGEGLNSQASYNEIGALYALGGVLALLSLTRIDHPRPRVFLFGVAFLLSVIGLALVQSRSAVLALGAALGIFVVLPFWKNFMGGRSIKIRVGKRGVRIVVFVWLIVGIFVFLLISDRLPINRFLLSFQSGSHPYESIVVRLVRWQEGFDLWVKDVGTFFFGYGSQAFRDLLGKPTTDNFYLDHVLGEGLIGLLVIMALVWWPIFELWRAGSGLLHMAFLAVVVATVVSFTGNVLVDPFYGGVTILVIYGCWAICACHRANMGGKIVR